MATSKPIFNDLELVIRLNQHIEDIAGSDEAAAAALLAKQTSFKVLAELDAVKNPDPRKDAQFEHQRCYDNRHDDDSDDRAPSQLPFHLQGDQDFNRASALSARRALRRSEAIKRNVLFLWEVARGRKKADVARTSSLDKLTGAHKQGATLSHSTENPSHSQNLHVIEEGDYTAVMLLIFKVLRDDFDLDVAQLQVHCDWEVDSQHGSSLGFEQFFSAVFELVDLWTCDIMEATYVRFLELLIRRITVRVIIFLDGMKLKLALSDNFDDAVVVKAIPLQTIQRFASVAKVVERKGVRTVGDLARADPQMIERERLAYLKEKNISKQKIGAELQHLLDTFNNLTEQVGAAGDSRSMYTLQNMKLVRRSNTTVSGRMDENDCSGLDTDPGRVRDTSNTGRSPSRAIAFEDKLASRPSLTLPSAPGAGSAMTTSLSDDSTTSSNNPGHKLPARSNTRRLSIHDLSQAESGIINSLRSAFILEKRISIVRKHGIDDVRNELEKFGVDPTPLSDAEVFEKYGGLYEMFVLRDGESIKALAQMMIDQIKMELQSHGVDVNDEDAEDTYDGFYGSVVAATGEEMVKDAQSWVGETLANNGAAPYIKADYHELKSLEQATLIGSQPGDDEFVSLLSNDDDDDNAEKGSSAGDDAGESVAAKLKNGSPIQRKQSHIRAKQYAPPSIQTSFPQAEREGEKTHSKADRSTVAPPRSPPTSPPSTRRRSGPRINAKVSDGPPAAGDKHKSIGSHDLAPSKHATHPRHTSRSKKERHDDSRLHATESLSVNDSVVDASDANEARAHDQTETSDTVKADTETATEVNDPLATPPEKRPATQDDDGCRRRASVSLRTTNSKSNLTVDLSSSELGVRDTVNDDRDRDVRGVEFGYDEGPLEAAKPEPAVKEM